MHKPLMKQFDWKGHLETLEDRRVMSADPIGGLLGEGIVHHSFDETIVHHELVEEAPPIEHHLDTGPDFWIDPTDPYTISEQIGEIEQTLASAHTTTGLNQVLADYGFTGKGQTVAIIDSGIAYNHFALGGGLGANYRVVGGYDFTENDANPYDDGTAGGHGTHVAGIVGGNAGSDHGVASGVDLVGLRVFDDSGAGYFSWVESALQWVHFNRNSFENPITAINLSLGVASWNSTTVPVWSTLEDEFALLKADGIFVAVSAGNAYATYNAPGLGYPAASPSVVPVMSVNDNGSLAGYSQRDVRAIAAPGSSIRSTVPDYKGNNNGIDDDYAYMSGTSMASPYIAGASVLIRQAMEFSGYTGITQDTIYNHMMATATSFVDSATNLTFKRLNLEAAIDALMPADDYGSTLATAFNLGTLTTTASQSGIISTLNDIDYFKFTAGSNGTVTFDSNGMTHELQAAWTVSGATGTVTGNQGEEVSFDVVAGQTYTVGFSSSGGLGHYNLNAFFESSNNFTYTDWGTVSYAQLNGLSVAGESWYRVQSSQAGYLTVEGAFAAQGGQVNLKLYDSNLQLVTTGNAVNGTTRVDALATAGEEFFVCVQGTNSNVDYRLSNLVSVTGTTVNVKGTAGNDTFTFSAGSTHQVVVNGVTHNFASIAVTNIVFNGGSGTDTIALTGTNAKETAIIASSSTTLIGIGYQVAASGVENSTVYGAGGGDIAYIYDSIGADLYETFSNHVTMSGTGYQNSAYNFSQTYAYASSGGVDRANMYDSAGNDLYRTYSDRVILSGTGFLNFAAGFESTYGYASQGNDVVFHFDSAGNDRFDAGPVTSSMQATNGAYFNQADSFDTVYAYASLGSDEAYLTDGATDDRYYAQSTSAFMRSTIGSYLNYVNGFDSVSAISSNGGFDYATLYDSTANDIFTGRSDYSRMEDSVGTFSNTVSGFAQNYAYSINGGTDQAHLYDSNGNDLFRAYSDRAILSGDGFYNNALGFKQAFGYASQGFDSAQMFDSAGNDQFTATPTTAVMQAVNNSYQNNADNFDEVFGYASLGFDEAFLYDGATNDRFISGPTYGLMRSLTGEFYNYAKSFDSVRAYSTAGGIDYATLYDSVGNDIFSGYASHGVMRDQAGTYYNYVEGFDGVYAYATAGGNDTADLFDSAGNDLFYGEGNLARLTGTNFRNLATGFESVQAHFENGGTDTVDLNAVDYLFTQIGS
ncbi:S8 family serine peptidase [Bythopirellula polymerisocia]|uniref:Subtilisin E n=1 Tax=Bythopirellula polymerisocia TaxID=2528003 RepID=A0A5C6CKU0_9BACT|nr:S8 family serine peptidase [Bythopirellula polymerisocia]TWU24675.1 Subtilisin E precursor [Bythopirellula polymerisocia]